MSQRPLLTPNLNNPIINGASMAAPIVGPPTNINQIPGISYDISWTGDPVGTFSIQVSNTYSQAPNGAVLNAGNWTVLPASAFVGTYPVAIGVPGNGFLDVVGTEACWIQFVYTPVSGTGALTVVPAAKVW
jgi:hypothetical protein